MRSLPGQFALPVFVLLVAVATGGVLGESEWGIAFGSLLAIGVAIYLGRRGQRKLNLIEEQTRRRAIDEEHRTGSFGHDPFDITARSIQYNMQNIRALRRDDLDRIERQTLVLDRMNDGLMRVAADGTVTYANVAAGTLFGGRNPVGRSFISTTRDHELNRALHVCLGTGDEQHHTLEIAGESRIVDAVMIRLTRNPPEALVMLRDITEVNRLQHLRRDFVSNVSHELRTPLATIKILTETLLELRSGDEEANEFLRKIDGEIDSMTALVRDLLDLTRIESPGSRLAMRHVDVAVLINDVCDRMRPLAATHSIDLRADVSPDVGLANLDERRLHQALINLVTNAIAHTPVRGTVTIAARGLPSRVVFSVQDTGSGIAAEDLSRIWERFFKTDRARTGPGTGLGLAIVKHIVQAHAGTVSAESTLGRGSTFTIEIPRGTVDDVQTPIDVERMYVPG